MNPALMPNPQSAPPANAGQQNGDVMSADAPMTLDRLAQALDAWHPPPTPESSDARPVAVAAPESVSPPAEEFEPANELSPEATTEEPHAGEETPAAGDDLSQFAELTSLEPDVRKHALDLARELKAHGLSVGEAKRIGKLLQQKSETESRHAQQIETLQREIADLKTGPATASEPALPMPPKVAALRNDAEIQRREMQLQSVLDWCEDNPEGGDTHGQNFSADEVKAIRRETRQELRWLPRRKEQLTAAAELAQVQRAAREQIARDFPVLQDPENPDARLAQQLLASEPALQSRPNRDYLALALATGHRALQEQLAQRRNPKPAATATARAKPAAGGATSAAPRPASGPGNANQLFKTAKERPSPAALEALLPHVR